MSTKPPKSTVKNTEKSVTTNKSKKYIKKSQREHILDRPDMYVGSLDLVKESAYVYENSIAKIRKRDIEISDGLLRIFVEPLSNAIDNVTRSRENKIPVSKIMINIEKDTGKTEIWNDGDYVPIEIHADEKCYVHTMIFGQFLTGENYDDTDEEARLGISGKNGLGVKLSSVFSTNFSVEGIDPSNKKKFFQEWKNNMEIVGEPVITKVKATDKSYTKVTFFPDFPRFGLKGYTQDLIDLFHKYAIDTALITKIPVVFNGVEISISSLSDYAAFYEDEITNSLFLKTETSEVYLIPSSTFEFENISFVNGIHTPFGGAHVDAWCEEVFRPILQKFNKGEEKPVLNINDVKKCFKIFVLANVPQPKFDSQSKKRLLSPAPQAFIKSAQIKAVLGWPTLSYLEDLIKLKNSTFLKKLERKKRGREFIKALDSANKEGGKTGRECTLLLVEGDSAKTYALEGIQHGVFGKKGKDWNGIYTLRGKFLNTREKSEKQIADNQIVEDLIKALDLQHNTDYSEDENFHTLRYGRILIVTDADTDGLHISGLLQNFFHSLHPSLLKRTPSFITSLQTPIVRVKDRYFYDEDEYREFVAEQRKLGKTISYKDKKYYKGLGACDNYDIVNTFGQKTIEFVDDKKTNNRMMLAFHKDQADLRKEWIAKYDPSIRPLVWNSDIQETKTLSYAQFIDTQVIKYSIDSCRRAIPSIIDGLKESQRKILYTVFLKKMKYSGAKTKVSQLGGAVSEKTGYKHGEKSLEMTITKMAASFVGGNNIPLLFRGGQFGSRLNGGTDAAAGRYIFTTVEELTRLIFRPEDDDLLNYLNDDGASIEPEFYVPILPMILVNGSEGIGTGWSCDIPAFNPLDLITCIKIWIENDGKIEEKTENTSVSLLPEITPWYREFMGHVIKDDENKYSSWGIMERNGNKIKVSELPIGMWTENFKFHLESMVEKKLISSYTNNCTPKIIDFTLTEKEDRSCNEKSLKLISSISTTNMVLFNKENRLRKYDKVDEIIDEFCKVRLEFYVKRKAKLLQKLEALIQRLTNMRRFLQEVTSNEIQLFTMKGGKRQSRKTLELVEELEEKLYDKIFKKASEEDEHAHEEEKEEDDEETKEKDEKKSRKKEEHGYEYLLSVQIGYITEENVLKLEKDIKNKQEEFDLLKKRKETDMWIADLDEFQTAYEKWVVKMAKEKCIVKAKKKKN